MVRTLFVALGLVAMLAGPALAGQCPTLIKQINDAVGAKTDDASKKAKALAAEAQKLHEAGKHAEAVAKAEEGAKAINLALKKK